MDALPMLSLGKPSSHSRTSRIFLGTLKQIRVRTRRLAVISLVLSLLGAGGLILNRHAIEQRRQAEAVRVSQSFLVKPVSLSFSTESSGVVSAERKVNLSPSVAGRIKALYVQEGDRVAGGQVIARMENAQVASRLSQADAQVEAVQADLDAKSARASRYQALLKAGAISQDYVDELNSQSRLALIRLGGTQGSLEVMQSSVPELVLASPALPVNL